MKCCLAFLPSGSQKNDFFLSYQSKLLGPGTSGEDFNIRDREVWKGLWDVRWPCWEPMSGDVAGGKQKGQERERGWEGAPRPQLLGGLLWSKEPE